MGLRSPYSPTISYPCIKNALSSVSCLPYVGQHGSHIDLNLIFLKNSIRESTPRIFFMELLLNLAWLLLALPAFWLWRGSKTASGGRTFTALRCVLALVCMLVVLFPVVSATDDLRAMGNEIEESPASKRTSHLASHDKISASKWQSPPALVTTAIYLIVSDQMEQPWLESRLLLPASPAIKRAIRGPPFSLAR